MTVLTDTPERKDRLAYWFMAGHLCIDWPFGAIYVIAPVIAASYGWSPAEVGLLLTIQSVVASLAYPYAGMIMDRTKARGRALAMTFFWVVAGYFMASFTDGFWPLAALLAFASIGDAAWHPMATGILMKSAPGRRAKVLGIHAIGGSLAVVGAPLIAGQLLADGDWRLTLQLVLVPPALMGLFILFYLGPKLPKVEHLEAAKPDLKELAKEWGTPFGLTLVAMMIFYNLAQTGATAMMPLYMQKNLGFDIGETSTAFAAVLLIGAVIQPWVGQASDRFGRRRVIACCTFLSAAGGLLTWSASGPVEALLGLTLCTGALTAVRSTFLASAVDLSGKSESTTLGIAFAVMDGIGAMGALLAGIAGEVDLANAFLLAAILATSSGLITCCMPRRKAA